MIHIHRSRDELSGVNRSRISTPLIHEDNRCIITTYDMCTSTSKESYYIYLLSLFKKFKIISYIPWTQAIRYRSFTMGIWFQPVQSNCVWIPELHDVWRVSLIPIHGIIFERNSYHTVLYDGYDVPCTYSYPPNYHRLSTIATEYGYYQQKSFEFTPTGNVFFIGAIPW